MPNLNTTIDNIELKSNKVTSISDPNTWTDAQYPSARVLLDIAHPIGSILTTATNESPASTLGGTWTLVDKAFKDKFIQLNSSHWAAAKATLTDFSGIMLAGHSMAFRLNLITTAELNDDTVTLGNLDITSCGISALTYAAWYNTALSDVGGCTICYGISQEGAVSVQDVLNVNGTHILPTGSSFYVHLVVPVNHEYMIDSFCDKFYWKRTA